MSSPEGSSEARIQIIEKKEFEEIWALSLEKLSSAKGTDQVPQVIRETILSLDPSRMTPEASKAHFEKAYQATVKGEDPLIASWAGEVLCYYLRDPSHSRFFPAKKAVTILATRVAGEGRKKGSRWPQDHQLVTNSAKGLVKGVGPSNFTTFTTGRAFKYSS